MAEFAGVLVGVGVLAAILGALVLLARRVRRSGVGGGIMGPLDEIYHPAAHRLRFEIQVREARLVPLPAPEDLAPEERSRHSD